VNVTLKTGNQSQPLMTVYSSEDAQNSNRFNALNVEVGSQLEFKFQPNNNVPDVTILPPSMFQATVRVQPGLTFGNRYKWIQNPYSLDTAFDFAINRTIIPYDFATKTTTPFTGTIISTIGANIRPQPNTTLPPVETILEGVLTFDAWTRTELVTYPGLGTSSDLWYRLADGRGWMSAAILNGAIPPIPPFVPILDKQVGLLGVDGNIYESSPGYSAGLYPDTLTSQPDNRWVTNQSGVQNQHSFGSLVGLGPQAPNLPSFQGQIKNHINIPQYFDVNERRSSAETAYVMSDLAKAELGSGHLSVPGCSPLGVNLAFPANCLISPEEQKGKDGQYSSAGLIEKLAEGASASGIPGFSNDFPEGYIPDDFESTILRKISQKNGAGQWIVVDPSNQSPDDIIISMLTPERLESFASGAIKPSDLWLDGWLEAAEFVLTAPDGQQLGYRNGQLFNNIPSSWLDEGEFLNVSPLGLPVGNIASQSTPTSLPYYPIEKYFYFFVGNRQSSFYDLEITGCSPNSKALVGDSGNSDLIYSGCGKTNVSVGIPEPSSFLGLVACGALGVGLRRLRKRRSV
jgi:hypothetical protein